MSTEHLPQKPTPEQQKEYSKQYLRYFGGFALACAGVYMGAIGYSYYQNTPSQLLVDEVFEVQSSSTVSQIVVEALKEIDANNNTNYLSSISNQQIQDQSREADDLNKTSRNQDYTQPGDEFILEISQSRNGRHYIDVKPLLNGTIVTESE